MADLPLLFLLLLGPAQAQPRPTPAREVFADAVKRHQRTVEHHELAIQVASNGTALTRRATLVLVNTPGEAGARIQYQRRPGQPGIIFEAAIGHEQSGNRIFLPSQDRWIPVTRETLDYIPAALLSAFDWLIQDPSKFAYQLRGRTRLDGVPTHVIVQSSLPEAGEDPGPQARRTYWLHKELLFPVQIRTYDSANRPLATLRFHELESIGGNAVRAGRVTIEEAATGAQTVLEVRSSSTAGTRLPPPSERLEARP